MPELSKLDLQTNHYPKFKRGKRKDWWQTGDSWSRRLVAARGAGVNLNRWTMIHPENWTTMDVLDWIYSVAQRIPNFEFENFRGENFNRLTGKDLLQMTQEEFIQLDSKYGAELHTIFQAMVKQADFHEPGTKESQFQPGSPDRIQNKIFDMSIAEQIGRSISIETEPFDYQLLQRNCLCADLLSDTSQWNEAQGKAGAGSCQESDLPYNEDVLYSQEVEDETDITMLPTDDCHECQAAVEPTRYSNSVAPSRPTGCTAPCESPRPPKRGPGRPRKNKPTPTPETAGIHKNIHLWEFLRDLLKDPQHLNHLVRWEDKQDGVFRVIRSKQVAHRWGIVKNNPTMTFDKLSRAIRFSRSVGYFSDVPKNKNFPKKLCFKFGPKAHGWGD